MAAGIVKGVSDKGSILVYSSGNYLETSLDNLILTEEAIRYLRDSFIGKRVEIDGDLDSAIISCMGESLNITLVVKGLASFRTNS